MIKKGDNYLEKRRSQKGIEIIDGKQRFESIKRFYSDEYPLTERGLKSHKGLSKKLFSELPVNIKDNFFDTKIRIVKYSVIDAARFSDKNQDLLKKEIFRRYNSGITPLKRVEVDKAIYIEDEPTKYFKKQLKKNKSLHSKFTGLFFDDYSDKKLDDPTHMEKSLQYIRFLLVIPDLPVLSTRNKTILDQYYEFYSDSYKNVQPIYSDFLEKVKFIKRLDSEFREKDCIANKYFWEVIYWLLSVLNKGHL